MISQRDVVLAVIGGVIGSVACLVWQSFVQNQRQAALKAPDDTEVVRNGKPATKRGKRKGKGTQNDADDGTSSSSASSKLSSSQQSSLASQWKAILKTGCGKDASPGLTASVVLDGSVLFSNAHGVVDVSAPETPLTPGHVLHCASLAKLFVATAIVQLEEEGKLKLEDKLCRHLPYFGLSDPVQWDHFDIPQPCAETVTIGQMLSHTAGIPDVHDDEYGWGVSDESDGAVEAYVRGLKAKERMIGAPGHVHMYVI